MQRTDSFAPENELKLVVLGQGAVGKSSITLRFVSGEFDEEYNPTLQETFRRNVVIDDKPIALGIYIVSLYCLCFSLENMV